MSAPAPSDAVVRRACADCAAPLGPRNRSGRCRRCVIIAVNNDPEAQKRRVEGIQRKFQDPAHVERMRRVMSRNFAEALSRPGYREQLSERGKHLAANALHTTEARAKFLAGRAEAGRKRSATVMAWCPEKYRPLYRRLTISKRMLRDDAQAHIERLIEVDRFNAIADRHLPDVLFFLRRDTVVREVEGGWLYGTARADAAGLVERALQKGWQP